MLAEPVSRPWRRYLRFSVRGLIVLVLVIGGWLGWMVRSARIQREAVAAIKNARGSVYYDWESRPGSLIPGGKPRAPRWLVDLIGVDYFGHVTTVALPEATDAAIAQVGRLTQLQYLVFEGSSLSDAGLAHLSGLTSLSTLGIGGPEFSDDWLVHLKGLTSLSQLELEYTQLTDRGLVHLNGLPNLSILNLFRTQVTDAGLLHLSELTSLSSLYLGDTHVTDRGLVHLKGLANLGILDLSGTQVTDAGMKELKQALPTLSVTVR